MAYRSIAYCTVLTSVALLAASAAWSVGPLHYRYDMQWGAAGNADGQFGEPQRLNIIGDRIAVGDKNNHRIQIFDLDGSFVAKLGTMGSGQDNLNLPFEGDYDTDLRLYIDDSSNSRVMRRSAALAYLTTWGGFGSGDTQLFVPFGLAVDRDSNWVYVADTYNSRISKWTTAGAHLLNFGSPGPDDGELNYPYDVAVGNGRVYVADAENDRIQEFTSNGAYVRQFDYAPTGLGHLVEPDACTVSPDGNHVFVTNTNSNQIVKYTVNGSYVSTFGSPGAGSGQLNEPTGVAVDDTGRVFVAEAGNNRIQRFRLNARPTNPTNLYVSPKPPYDNDDLAAHSGGSTDADGDTLSYRYAWYESTNNSAPWTRVKQARILPAGLTQPNRWYRFEVHVWDGYDFSQWVVSTSVKVRAQAALPALTATAQQAPNGTIAISVTLTGAAVVGGELCNLAGRTVAALPARELPAGSSTIVLNALSARGTKLPAGQYLMRLTARTRQGQAASLLVPLSLR